MQGHEWGEKERECVCLHIECEEGRERHCGGIFMFIIVLFAHSNSLTLPLLIKQRLHLITFTHMICVFHEDSYTS